MTPERKINPWLKVGLEFGPLLLFFAVFMRLRERSVMLAGTEYSGFVVATLVFVPVLVLSTLALWRLTGRLAPMQIATLVLVVVFGGLSVWLNDPKFFKMKPTIIYLLFAALLAISLLLRRNWLQLVMSEALPMDAEGWRILTRRLVALFLGLALANELVWRSMSETAWVNFKTFGLPAIMVVFFVLNARLFERHAVSRDD
ncbi:MULTISPECIES: inner membrane-spanning protein YciB [unclassified Paracoccus (in: a-proteobacteria)]|uniref:inner membrane-spanning protein YciB n=1 Tax=unclassified Paracoccus (in: a-proteobacteria) TaxID=2688777 RepID=UPI001352A299|nr:MULTISPECIES: inner membrane-spanning protein YciB [unclassified Paracoccus (in: a-proteobacteria)]UXU74041.1 septation protein IspZ [Paracoccus sp. SMMA_5]UXU79930.1 septation protein IspZ [Paracoccus sp. SMMA_5_TC]